LKGGNQVKKTEKADNLKQLALEHYWLPIRPWNVVTAPRGFTIFTEGSGCRLTDIDGKTYLDYWGSVSGCNAVGYSRKEVADAVYEQMMQLMFTPAHDLAPVKIKLAKKLADIAPTGNSSKVFFGSGGAESIETAIAIAKKYQILSGFRNKYKILAGYEYHGSTAGAMAVGWRPPAFRWDDYEPLMPGVLHVPSPYCSICDFDLKYPSCDLLCAKYVETVIQYEIPETVAAFLDDVEPFTGHIAPPEYWPMIRSICDKYGVLLILDEVQTGFGRTGKMFAIENWGVVPDIIVVAKALASSYVPLSAAIVRREIAEKFEGGPKEMLNHSYTWEGHPCGCAAALATLEIIEKEKLVENANTMGKYLFEQLQSLYKYDMVGEIRGGLGLLCCIDLVKDRKTKNRFSPDENAKLRSMLKEKLMDASLFGMFSNPIPIVPSLIITKKEIDEIVGGFDKVIGEIQKELHVSR